MKRQCPTQAVPNSGTAGSGRGRSGCVGSASERTLTANSAPLPLAESTPDAELFTVRQRVLETVVPNLTPLADRFGLLGGCSALREEQIGINTKTVGRELPPVVFFLVHSVAHPFSSAVITYV